MTNPTIVFMYSTGLSPAGEFFLPDGTALFPISTTVDPSSGVTTNTFAVPIAHRNLAYTAGLESDADVQLRTPQGPTSARPVAPPDGQSFYDTTIGQLVFYSTQQATWVLNRNYRGLRT